MATTKKTQERIHTIKALNGMLRCSGCEQSAEQAGKVITLSPGSYICRDCVSLCADLLIEQGFTLMTMNKPTVEEKEGWFYINKAPLAAETQTLLEEGETT